jgi:uncharacterized protein YndB with AHSA1/START domain
MMRWLLIVGGVLVGLVALTLVVGLLLPAAHTAATRAHYAAPAADVWAAVSDWERWGEWQPEIRTVERLPDRDGHPVLLTSGSWGDMPMEILESDPPRRFVTEVDGGAFRGRWTYELEPADNGTRLTITEEGQVSNPLFRAFMIFHDNYATMLEYYRALGERLNVEVVGQEIVASAIEG